MAKMQSLSSPPQFSPPPGIKAGTFGRTISAETGILARFLSIVGKTAMLKGKVSQWNDEKGFGFIEVEGKKTRIFFHVSSLKNRQHRPSVGEDVVFQASKDQQGRIKASTVAVLDAPQTVPATQQQRHSPQQRQKQQRIHITPPQKEILDYLGILIAFLCMAFAGYRLYAGQDPVSLWPLAILFVGGMALTQRRKTPKQPAFSCAKCHTIERFGSRTIAAWNRGTTRLFCQSCHSHWLRSQPQKPHSQASSDSGCLGALAMLLILPIATGWAVFELFI